MNSCLVVGTPALSSGRSLAAWLSPEMRDRLVWTPSTTMFASLCTLVLLCIAARSEITIMLASLPIDLRYAAHSKVLQGVLVSEAPLEVTCRYTRDVRWGVQRWIGCAVHMLTPTLLFPRFSTTK